MAAFDAVARYYDVHVEPDSDPQVRMIYTHDPLAVARVDAPAIEARGRESQRASGNPAG